MLRHGRVQVKQGLLNLLAKVCRHVLMHRPVVVEVGWGGIEHVYSFGVYLVFVHKLFPYGDVECGGIYSKTKLASFHARVAPQLQRRGARGYVLV